LASARPHECSPTWRHGSAEGYERTSGDNGKTAPTASKNYDSVACQSSTRRLLPARRPVSGACPDIRPSNRLCATRISPVSVFPASTFLATLNLIEPPWYGPVCPVVWEGWRHEVSPYPDLRRNLSLRRRSAHHPQTGGCRSQHFLTALRRLVRSKAYVLHKLCAKR